jgi:ABC-type multidrug transport system fused ATPase/permease subunit
VTLITDDESNEVLTAEPGSTDSRSLGGADTAGQSPLNGGNETAEASGPDGGGEAAPASSAEVGLAPLVRLRTVFRQFWPHLRPFRVAMAVIVCLVIVAPALVAATTWLFKITIDTVVVTGNLAAFPPVAMAFIGLALAQGAVSFTDYYLTVWVGERFILALRTDLFAHLHRLAPDTLVRRSLGDMLSRLTTDVEVIEQLLLAQLTQALSYVFQFIFFATALCLLDWRLVVVAFIGVPVFILLARIFSRRIRRATREKGRRVGQISGIAEESLGNAALVRAYDRFTEERVKFFEQSQAGMRAQLEATRMQALYGPLSNLTQVVGVLAVFGAAVWEIGHGHITIGGLFAFIAYLGQMYVPAQSLGQLVQSMFAANASAERVIELLDQQPSPAEPVSPVALGTARGAVRLRNVTFTYPDTIRPALDGVDLDIEPGQRVAVVGASGAGKSTLAMLLLRFQDPDAGAVSLDDVDLRSLTSRDLYRNVCPVLQETLVFDGTVADNIGWGRPDASREDIEAAARAADAHAFIETLPHGYRTRMGQRGRLLSGGQRQRIALARALIRDAPVLLLDEPTTGLDGEAVERLMAVLRRVTAGRTTIVISHDWRVVADAERVVFLRQGRIAATGTHEQLLRDEPDYAALYEDTRSLAPNNRQLSRAVPPPATPSDERAMTSTVVGS